MKTLTEAKASLQDCVYQWGNYEDNYGQLVGWMSETEDSLKGGDELQPGLIEKKVHVDKYRVSSYVISTHLIVPLCRAQNGAHVVGLSVCVAVYARNIPP